MIRRVSPDKKTTMARVKQYELILPMLKSMYAEFQELSKKKPEGKVTVTKIKMVNRLLLPIHDILAEEENLAYLDLIDEDEIPENSDVIIILSQTVAAMEAYQQRYTYWTGSDHVWHT